MDIRIVREPVNPKILEELMHSYNRTFVKGAADIERGLLALGGEWHMDANTLLIADGSEQKNLWGFNIYPGKSGDNAIEYDSFINIRPGQGNRGREIMDAQIRSVIRALVGKLVPTLSL